MPITDDLLALMPDAVVYEPRTGQDAYNRPTYGPAVTYRARVSGRTQMVRTPTGEERVSYVQAWLAGTGTKTTGRFTLPGRFVPRQPLAVAVAQVSDEAGPSHEVVFF